MPKYIIHIGPPRTGSKFIQSQLFHSRPHFEQNGVTYPDVWLRGPNDVMQMTHSFLLYALRDGRDLTAEFRQLNAGRFHTIILSCEGLDNLALPAINRLKNYICDNPVEIVYYVRRWSERILSSWRQRVAMGNFTTFPEDYVRIVTDPLRITAVNYSRAWRGYEEVFGRECLRLIPFNNLIENGVDLFQHFCSSIVGLRDLPQIDLRLIRHNRGPDAFETEIIRGLNFLYFEESSCADPTMRIAFNRLVKSYNLGALEDHLKTDVCESRFQDDAEHLRMAWDAIRAYRDRLVSPEYGKEFFSRGSVNVQYIGQNYLLRNGAADELAKLYKQLRKYELSERETVRIGLHPQKVDVNNDVRGIKSVKPRPQKQRYILHIGPPKTGSKYLQSQLFHNRKYLEKRGILYPEVWLMGPGKSKHVTHDLLLYQLRDGKDLAGDFDVINAGGFDTVVLSCEGLDGLTVPILERLKSYIGDRQVEVVYYVRRWSDRISSEWRQWVTMGHFTTFPEFYTRLLTAPESTADLNYSLAWERYAKVFGRDTLRLVSFSNLLDNRIDLFKHFCDLIVGISGVPEIDRRLIRQNPGPSVLDTEIIRGLNFLYFEETSRADPTMRIIFNKIKEGYDLQPLQNHLKSDLREFQIEDGAQHFLPVWEAIRAYEDRLISPEHGSEFFRHGRVRMEYVGQNYLFRRDAAEELMKLHKWMGSYELTTKERARIDAHPQDLSTFASRSAYA